MTFWDYDATSPKAHCGRFRTYSTPGEARCYERGYWDHKAGAVPIEPYAAYRDGYFDAKSEALEKQDRESWGDTE